MWKNSESPLGVGCCCLPLRVAVFLFMLYALVLSAAAALSYITEDTRILVGGYNYYAHYVVFAFGLVGTVICVAGLIGLRENRRNFVRCFVAYFFVRLIFIPCILAVDASTLSACATYSTSGTTISSTTGMFNRAIASVAFRDSCVETEFFHYAWSALDIIISLWGVITCYRWVRIQDSGCSYSIVLSAPHTFKYYGGAASSQSESDYSDGMLPPQFQQQHVVL